MEFDKEIEVMIEERKQQILKEREITALSASRDALKLELAVIEDRLAGDEFCAFGCISRPSAGLYDKIDEEAKRRIDVEESAGSTKHG